jgi:hypothetical protein
LIKFNVGKEREEYSWSLPVVAETYDGVLNDINGFHIKDSHVFKAIDNVNDKAVEEGCVGGGTGTLFPSFHSLLFSVPLSSSLSFLSFPSSFFFDILLYFIDI